jgi:hypothetical protein
MPGTVTLADGPKDSAIFSRTELASGLFETLNMTGESRLFIAKFINRH